MTLNMFLPAIAGLTDMDRKETIITPEGLVLAPEIVPEITPVMIVIIPDLLADTIQGDLDPETEDPPGIGDVPLLLGEIIDLIILLIEIVMIPRIIILPDLTDLQPGSLMDLL